MEENENFIHNKYGYCYYSTDTIPLIFNLYIESIYRKQGHAKHLIQLVIKEIREFGFDGEIYIKAEPYEDSISIKDIINFYREMGLKIL